MGLPCVLSLKSCRQKLIYGSGWSDWFQKRLLNAELKSFPASEATTRISAPRKSKFAYLTLPVPGACGPGPQSGLVMLLGMLRVHPCPSVVPPGAGQFIGSVWYRGELRAR